MKPIREHFTEDILPSPLVELVFDYLKPTILDAIEAFRCNDRWHAPIKCGACGATPTNYEKNKLLCCGACSAIRYCDKQCQRKNWNTHTMKCAQLKTIRQDYKKDRENKRIARLKEKNMLIE